MLWTMAEFPFFLRLKSIPFSVSLFIYGHLGYFKLLDSMNNASMNMGMQMFFQDSVLISFS